MPLKADPVPSQDASAATETTPLLGASEAATASSQENAKLMTETNGKPSGGTSGVAESQPDNGDVEEGKPMRYVQILLLCYASLAEPVAYFAIFPFINEMIERTGNIEESSVGFWAGLIESLFSLVQMVLMIFYGRMADRLGRKPVLIFSLAGVSFATALFGLSATLWQMILFRCVAGVFAGSSVTVRTMISENTNKYTQGRAFSWYMFARNMGILIGPLIGGGLANPAKQFPGTIGKVQFFKDFPYAFSSFVAGSVCLVGMLLNWIFLKETLKRDTDGSGNPEPPMSTWQVLNSPGVPAVLLIYGHITVLGLSYTSVSPVFQYTGIEKGGFHFSPAQISYLLAIAGASQALWMLILFPPLQRRFGTGNVLRGAAIAWPVFLVFYPVLNEILRAGWYGALWPILVPVLILGSGVAMGYACVQLCVNDISPSPTVLATVNALALTLTTGIRAVVPVLFTSIFAFGVKWGWADGHLVWFILVGLALLLNPLLFLLPAAAEGKLDRKPRTANDDES